mmetsp:Transcript_29547/g.42262  ORF Transcript_29547/g.42262 Transcript_29547/m.42262 type:complete len:414 (+) Transcript_29547:60-1301(+)
MSNFVCSTFCIFNAVWNHVSSFMEPPLTATSHTISAVQSFSSTVVESFLLPVMAPFLTHLVDPVVGLIKDHVFPILGMHSPNERLFICSEDTPAISDDVTGPDQSDNALQRKPQNIVYIRAHDLNNSVILEHSAMRKFSSVSDTLEVKESWIELSDKGDVTKNALAKQALDGLCHLALQYVIIDELPNSYFSNTVKWTAENGTVKCLNKMQREPRKSMSILEREILVWTGRLCKPQYDCGMMDTPMFRAKGIVSGISPYALVNLLLDSSRVKTYNRWTNGRVDYCVFQELLDGASGDFGVGVSKIVVSESSLPFMNRKLKLTCLMHARRLNESEEDTYLIVSRSGHVGQSPTQPDDELLLGVNMIKGVKGHPQKVELISMSHMKSSVIPSFLVKKAGIGGMLEFFERLRKLSS